MREQITEFTIVLPAYNEEKNVSVLYEKIVESLSGKYVNYEIIYIDDGSTDNTRGELEKLKLKDERVKLIKFKRNFGKSAAYAAGFKNASKDVIVTMDSDLQDDPAEIPNLLKKLEEGVDYVSGWKFQGKGNPYRAWPSKIFNFIVRKITKLELNDFNCPFKAFRKEALDPNDIYGELYRFLPVLAHGKGYKIAEVPVKNYPRLTGKSKYGLERFVRGFFDLMTIHFITRYLRRPLHLIGSIGVIFSGTGSLVIFGLYIRKFIFSVPINQTPFLFAVGVLLIIVGIQLVSMGLISELILKLFSRQSGDIYHEDS